MLFEVMLDARVEDDFIEAFAYYEEISPALGDNFLAHFENVPHRLTIHPEHYFNPTQKLRRITLGNSPYAKFSPPIFSLFFNT